MTESTGRAAGVPPDRARVQAAFSQLVEVVARLRAPDGCPWDRVQTLKSIMPHTLEETFEVLEAIDANDNPAICEELGDLLLQVVLYAQIAADEGRFDLLPVIQGITEKLIRRHPHVFGDVAASTVDQVSENWERIKQQEKTRESAIDGLPVAMPSLARAVRLQSKAAKAGFEWPRREALWLKLQEEIRELADELFQDGQPPETWPLETERSPETPLSPEQQARAEEELGDVLFVIANLARRWGINPEDALRRSNQKFSKRFRAVEQAFAMQGKKLSEIPLPQMEAVYHEIKVLEKLVAAEVWTVVREPDEPA